LPRKPKAIDTPAKTELFARTNRRRLNTVGAIASEQGKIYRAAASGVIETGEAMRLSMILRELRAALEAAEAAAVINGNALQATVADMSPIWVVPHGAQFAEDRKTLIWPTTGAPAEPLPFTPATPPPPLNLLSDQSSAEPERLPVIEAIDDGKVVILRPHAGDDDPARIELNLPRRGNAIRVLPLKSLRYRPDRHSCPYFTPYQHTPQCVSAGAVSYRLGRRGPPPASCERSAWLLEQASADLPAPPDADPRRGGENPLTT
jgi:hypothetical protein